MNKSDTSIMFGAFQNDDDEGDHKSGYRLELLTMQCPSITDAIKMML